MTDADYEFDPTIQAHPHSDALTDAKALRKAMKGLGTDEDAIIEVLTKRSAAQRLDIKQAFKNEFGRDIIKDLKSELGGNFEDLVLALMEDTFEYVAKELHDAMSKIGTNEDVLTEILCTRGNYEIQEVNAAYERVYGKSLESEVSGEVSGEYKRLLTMLLTEPRSTEPAEAIDPIEVATTIYNAGEGTMGTDEETFVVLLAHQSFSQLRLIFRAYEQISGKMFEQAVKAELGGDLKEAILTIARRAESQPRYFAERLHEAMKGAGTEDRTLIRIIVSRSELDLEAIKREYQGLYHKTLESDIKSETGGDYGKALISIIQGNQ